MRTQNTQTGFTLVEVGVIVPILMIIALSLFQILFSMVQTSDLEKTRIDITYEKQMAMDTIESDVRLSSSFLTTTDSSDPDPYQTFSNGGPWNFAGSDSSHRVLIIQSFSTTTNPLDGTRQPVYIGSGTACDASNLQSDTPLTYDTVYFTYQGTLYRRRLIDSTTATCDTQYQQLSCPSSALLGGMSQNAACGADDEVIATDVSDFEVQYYNTGASTTASDVYSGNSSGVSAARSIELTLAQSRRSAGQMVTESSDLRIATLNEGGD